MNRQLKWMSELKEEAQVKFYRMFLKINLTLVTVILSGSIVSCGNKNSSKNEESVSIPKVNYAQLKMIESTDQNLRDLGWASIEYSLKKGAKPDLKLESNIKAIAKKSNDFGSSKVLQQFNDPELMKKNNDLIESVRTNGVDQQEILELAKTNNPSDLFHLETIKNELIDSKPLFGIADFMKDSNFAEVKQNDFGPFQVSEDDFTAQNSIKVSDHASIKLFPGKLKSGLAFNLRNDQRRSDGNSCYSNYNVLPTHTNMVSLQDFVLKEEGYKGLYFPNDQNYALQQIRKQFNEGGNSSELFCMFTASNVNVEWHGFYPPNADGNQKYRKNQFFSCLGFEKSSAPAYKETDVSRYRWKISSYFDEQVFPGSYKSSATNVFSVPDQVNRIWYERFPAIQSEIEENVDSKMSWVGVKLSLDKTGIPKFDYFAEQVSKNLGTVHCTKGCTQQEPIAVIDGTLIFGLNGAAKVKFKVINPVPGIPAYQGGLFVNVNIDILKPSEFKFENPQDPGELPLLFSQVKVEDWSSFLTLISRSFEPGQWMIPELGSTALNGFVSLNRLSVFHQLISKTAWGSRQMRESFASAFIRNSMPTYKKELIRLNVSVGLLNQVKLSLDLAIQHLDSLSSNEAYQRIGQAFESLGRENTTLIEDKQILQESIIGAWELVQAEIQKQSLEIGILTRVMSAIDYSIYKQKHDSKEAIHE